MHTAVQSGGRSPKRLNGASGSQRKSGSDGTQNCGLSKGKKRDRGEGNEPTKLDRDHPVKIDESEPGHFKVDSIKSEIAKFTEKGQLPHAEAVEKLVHLMQLIGNERKIDFAGQLMLADIIAATESPDCLDRFVQLGGVPVLGDWLIDAQFHALAKSCEGSSPKETDEPIEELLLTLLHALAKLPINFIISQSGTIWIRISVSDLRNHKNLEIQKKARCLFDIWERHVAAEIKSASLPAEASPGRARFPKICNSRNRRIGSTKPNLKNPVSQVSSSKVALTAKMAVERMKMEMEVEGGSSSAALRGSDGLSQTQNFQWLMRRCDPVSSYSSSISTSGTTLSFSTTYTSSRGSHLQSSDDIGDDECNYDPRLVQKLVFKFSGGNATAVERWLSVVDATWVLHVTDDAAQGRLWPLRQFAQRWSMALTKTVKSVLHAVQDYDYELSNKGQKGENVEDYVSGRLYTTEVFVQFMEAIILKMHPFVIVICSVGTAETGNSGDGWAVTVDKLQALVELTEPLEKAKEATAFLRHHSSPNPDAKCIDDAMKMLEKAILDTIHEIRTGILSSKDDDDSGNTEILQRSPGVDTITRSVIKCINLLVGNRYSPSIIAQEVRKVSMYPSRDETRLPNSPIMDLVSCLEEKLDEKSQSFADHGLRFLFLLNNTSFMLNQLHHTFVANSPLNTLTRKIDDYIQKYLQVSWEPMLSCLHGSSTPLCLSLSRSSPLLKFESEFQKTYAAQKLWKVPDPNMRRKLREAIIKKVTSGLTKYLEDNNESGAARRVTRAWAAAAGRPRFTPQELEEMLQELFEG